MKLQLITLFILIICIALGLFSLQSAFKVTANLGQLLASWEDYELQQQQQQVVNHLLLASREDYELQQQQQQVDHQHHHKNSWFAKNMSTIRSWGCNRTETPFIFVHIGKAGGGSVRARIAASSLNYTKKSFKMTDGSYYPLPNNNTKARFCNGCYTNRRAYPHKSMEGTLLCNASTPLGRSIACPEPLARQNHQLECHSQSETCAIVYVGHNWFGSELHWLPGPYLNKWWSANYYNYYHPHNKDDNKDENMDMDIIIPFRKLNPNETNMWWCPSHKTRRPYDVKEYEKLYKDCSIPLAQEVDAKAAQAVSSSGAVVTSWAPMYASLPVLRVTMMRNPFDWLMSTYLWHGGKKASTTTTCDNIDEAILKGGAKITEHMKQTARGWLTRQCYIHIMNLCGEDCIVRYTMGHATLVDLEQQAEENLRHSFAVVGLLEDVDTFYKMITARVQYMNTTLNLHVEGGRHSTSSEGEALRCKERFRDVNFQKELLAASPELRALVRLYNVAKEVNRFQVEELQQCSSEGVFLTK